MARLPGVVVAVTAIGLSGPGLLAVALPIHPRPGVRRGLILFLGLCIGISFWAAVGLAAFFLGESDGPALVAGDGVLAAIAGITIAALRWKIKPGYGPTLAPAASERVSRCMLGLLILAVGGSAAIFAMQVRQHPDGGWDAWAIWNLRSRFIFARSAYVFDPGFSHADYTPLWPMLIARIGWLMGKPSTIVPIGCAAVAALLNLGILLLGVAWFRGLQIGLLAAMVLLGTQEFIVHAADQFADLPLACIFLSASVLLAIFLDSHSKPPIRLALLAGLVAGAGALVKNEGIIFLLALFAGLVVAGLRFPGLRKLPGAAAFFAGAVPFLFLFGVFKVYFAPPSDLMRDEKAFVVAYDIDSAKSANAENGLIHRRPPSLRARLTDPRRYGTVLLAVLNRLIRIDRWNVFLLGAVAFFFVRPKSIRYAAARTAIGLAILMTCGVYFMVFVATPHDLLWHINGSMNRLILQIWGVLLFLVSQRLMNSGTGDQEKGGPERTALADESG